MKSSEIGASVEGESLILQSRKYTVHVPYRDRDTKMMVYPFKLSIFGIATIKKALSGVNPVNPTSFIDEDDEVHGTSLSGHSSKILGRETVQHATHTHKATFVTTRGLSYAVVEAGTREQMQQVAVDA